MKILIAKNDEDIKKCYSCFKQLRPNIKKSAFTTKINQLRKTGYYLIYLEDNKIVVTVVLFHITENIGRGKYLYVDEFITKEASRSNGYGGKVFKWLISFAKKEACKSLHLDVGVSRHRAHRFYFLHEMQIVSHHFSYDLDN